MQKELKNLACFCAENKDNYMTADVWKDIQIIGNIYENPELMEIAK